MKKFCCFACVALLMVVVCVPCFATSVPETTSSEPIDWFGGQTVGSYSVSFDETIYVNTSYSDNLAVFNSWLTSIGAVDSASAVGVVNITTSSPVDYNNAKIYSDGGRVKFTGVGTGGNVDHIRSGSVSVSSASGYDVALTLPSTTVTPVFVGSDGLIDSGVNAAISYLGDVLTYIWTTPSIMICIGLAVGVVLIGWGISKVKDLVVGY